jgi:nucleotide-binding universal stress UspA family protein
MMSVRDLAGAVVVGVDGSEAAMHALDWAAHQARLEDRPLTLLHVATLGTVAGLGVDTRAISSVMQSEGRAVLQRASERAAAHGVGAIHSELLMDDPRSVLLDASRHAHLVVVGSRGRGPVASLLLGSVGVALTQHAACPVVVRRPGAAPRPGLGVLVATDGLAHSEPAVEWGARVAELRQRPLTLVRTVFDGLPPGRVDPDDGTHADVWAGLRAAAERVGRARPSLEVSLRVQRGLADEALVRAAAGMDVLVLGPHARRSMLDILDLDVTTRLVERAPCVVAVVPADRRGVAAGVSAEAR